MVRVRPGHSPPVGAFVGSGGLNRPSNERCEHVLKITNQKGKVDCIAWGQGSKVP